MTRNFSALAHPTAATTVTAWDLADEIRRREPATLGAVHSIIHHPRSLARPVLAWRPPTKKVPRVIGRGRLSIAVTRHRAGARARARALGYGAQREPAYVVSLRIADPGGAPVAGNAAEGWARAIVGEEHIGFVHAVDSGRVQTFVWMADAAFTPVDSPASLYAGFSAVA